MSEAVTVEDKTNRYNANATGKQEQLWPASQDAHTPWRRRVAAVSTTEADQLTAPEQRSSR